MGLAGDQRRGCGCVRVVINAAAALRAKKAGQVCGASQNQTFLESRCIWDYIGVGSTRSNYKLAHDSFPRSRLEDSICRNLRLSSIEFSVICKIFQFYSRYLVINDTGVVSNITRNNLDN